MDKYLDLFGKLLPLHELRIEETLNQSAIDLNEFLDYSQARLNLFTENHIEATRFREKNPGVGWFDHTQAIADTKKIQGVVIRMLEKVSPKNSNNMTGPLLATIHWLNDDPIPKGCKSLAEKHNLRESYLYKCWGIVYKGDRTKENLIKARDFITKPHALQLLEKELKEFKK